MRETQEFEPGAKDAAARIRIVTACMLLFADRTSPRITGASIAKAAGISEATLWRAFTNKSELLRSMYDYAWRTVASIVKNAWYLDKGWITDPAEALLRDFDSIAQAWTDESLQPSIYVAFASWERDEVTTMIGKPKSQDEFITLHLLPRVALACSTRHLRPKPEDLLNQLMSVMASHIKIWNEIPEQYYSNLSPHELHGALNTLLRPSGGTNTDDRRPLQDSGVHQ